MPAWRDWLAGFATATAYLLLLGACDPAPAAIDTGAANHDQERTMDRYLTRDEQGDLLKVLKEAAGRDALARRDYAVVRALLHSGLRIGEFSKVTVGDAMTALRGRYLFIPREHRKGAGRVSPKTGKPVAVADHHVFVTRALEKDLRDLLKVRHEMHPGDCREADPLVIGRHGNGLTVRSFELRYKAAARLAGLARSSPHWLRHTRAQNIMRDSTARDARGVVQRALGHADIRSSGIYTETPREDVEAALAEVDDPGARVRSADLRRAWERRAAA